MSSQFERCLIDRCAPTLAGIKVGSLFRYARSPGEDLETLVAHWNERFRIKGLVLRLLHVGQKSGLIYVYRPEKLKALLAENAVRSFLARRGFDGSGNPEICLQEIERRLKERDCFPHEIGILLGYPLEDVEGFIANKGENCRLCGLWKVYGREDVAKGLFVRYRHCLAVYRALFEKGMDILKLTVAVQPANFNTERHETDEENSSCLLERYGKYGNHGPGDCKERYRGRRPGDPLYRLRVHP